MNTDNGKLFSYSPSGASKTCTACGTIYDLHGFDQTDVIPPVGDTCELCAPDLDDEFGLGADGFGDLRYNA